MGRSKARQCGGQEADHPRGQTPRSRRHLFRFLRWVWSEDRSNFHKSGRTPHRPLWRRSCCRHVVPFGPVLCHGHDVFGDQGGRALDSPLRYRRSFDPGGCWLPLLAGDEEALTEPTSDRVSAHSAVSRPMVCGQARRFRPSNLILGPNVSLAFDTLGP